MRLMRGRMRAVTLAVAIAFVIVAGQLVRLGLQDPPQVRLSTS